MRLILLIALAPLAVGCEQLKVYWHETAGISPTELLPLYKQEKQYVTDRELEAKVRGAVGPGVDVDVYLGAVTLTGASARDAEAARRVRGVNSVEVK